MLTVEKLRKFGANVDKGLARCADNETLYLRIVGITVKDLSSGALGEALEAGDLDKAFDIAHKLKGGVNNLELTPIALPLSELTDLLRRKAPGDHMALYAEIVSKTNELASLCE
ncbi:MAG: Hpt domain-containing protein [Clostridia bacterium]|nr:Hpt domain-containing protein [Clostridia bacterium]